MTELGKLIWHDDGQGGLRWAGKGDVTSDETTFGYWGPVGKNTKLSISETNPSGYDLWVWHGPGGIAYGVMGADLREMKRAHRLGWYPREAEAREAAEAFYATGKYGTFTPPTLTGRFYVGSDLTGTLLYFGSPTDSTQIAADHQLDAHDFTFTLRKGILWESTTATDAEVRAKEGQLIIATGANNPEIGYNLTPGWTSP